MNAIVNPSNDRAAAPSSLLSYALECKYEFLRVLRTPAFAVPTLLSLLLIRSQEIDYELARGGEKGSERGKPAGFSILLKDKALVIFLGCGYFFILPMPQSCRCLARCWPRARGAVRCCSWPPASSPPSWWLH